MSQCSLMMLSYFFEQMQSRVIEKLPVKRAMGVWLADSGNAARGCAFSSCRIHNMGCFSFIEFLVTN